MSVKDTPEHVLRLQAQHFLLRPYDERFRIGLSMMEDGKRMVEDALRQQHPDWSVGELKAAVFRRMYRQDFEPDELERIAASFVAYYHNK